VLRRGWSTTLIQQLLGPGDDAAPNAQYPGAADMRLFFRARVLEAERGAAFQRVQDRRLRKQCREREVLAREQRFDAMQTERSA
jgi:hypothetical protein